MASPVHLHRLGLLSYGPAWRLQKEAADAVREGTGPERLILLQHPPVYTLGRRARRDSMLASEDYLRSLGADVFEVDRGGDVTFHGPGQLVAYPILDLRARGLGPADYVRKLEATVVAVLSVYGITAQRVPGRPGVWAAGGKVCSIGVRVQKGVTTHGLALNVDTDLSWFRQIVPCGLPDVVMTSMARIQGEAPPLVEVEDEFLRAFGRVFDTEVASAAQEAVMSHG